MGDTLSLEVVTPERIVLKGVQTDSLIVPSVEGLLGILPNHAPMVASLRIGILKYKKDGKFQKMAISGGFLEVADNKAVILADTAETSGEIDAMRAKAARERAEARLRGRRADVDLARAEAALHRAQARLRAVEKEQ